MCIFLAIILLSLTLVTLPSSLFAENDQTQACRNAAGYKVDGGVEFDKLYPETAIAFCEQALAARPHDLTVLAYYSRALLKLRRYEDALQAATRSANGRDPVGQRVLANMYETGSGAKKDLRQLLNWCVSLRIKAIQWLNGTWGGCTNRVLA
jgi:hypothetical protein